MRLFSDRLTSRGALLAVIAIGCLGRIVFSLITAAPGARFEAFNIAEAVAEGRGFADAFGEGHGPTAHMLPTSPLIAGTIYAILGVRSFAAETVLATYALCLSLGTLLLFYRAFGNIGTQKAARRLALFAGLLLPIYTGEEVVDFRIWEGGLAAFLTAAFLYILTSASMSNRRLSRLWQIATTNAMLFFVNPAFGIAAYLCSARALLCGNSLAGLLRIVLIMGVPVTLLVGPWTIRNALVFNQFIPLRSNAGLELAVGINPAAVETPDPKKTFEERLYEIHPLRSANLLRMQQWGGEYIYSQSLARTTTSWIAQNPAATAHLAVRHVRQIIAPEQWQFSIGPGHFAWLRSTIASIIGVAGMVGLLFGLWTRGVGWHYVALLIVVPMVLLSPFQPIPRYTYLFYPLFLFAATGLATRWPIPVRRAA